MCVAHVLFGGVCHHPPPRIPEGTNQEITEKGVLFDWRTFNYFDSCPGFSSGPYIFGIDERNSKRTQRISLYFYGDTTWATSRGRFSRRSASLFQCKVFSHRDTARNMRDAVELYLVDKPPFPEVSRA